MREKKELWKSKRMYGQFVREILETTDEKGTWNWLRKADMKFETETLLFATQEQTIRTKYVKQKIDKTVQSPLCTMFDKKILSANVKNCRKRSRREGTIMLQK